MRDLMIVASAIVATACGNIETTGETTGSGRQVAGEGLTAGRDASILAFGEESYGVGASWYDYESTTHVLTPRPEVYVARRDDTLAAFEVVSYYDDEGESGYFTLRGRHHEGQWSDTSTLTLSKSVKDETICARVVPLEEVSCGDAHDLVFRTSLRPIPAAGFAVLDPAIFVTNHVNDTERLEFAAIAAESVDEVERWSDEAVTLVSAAAEPSSSRVGWILHPDLEAPPATLQLQYTPNMRLMAWRIASIEARERLRVSFDVWCADGQAPDEVAFPREPRVVDVTLPSGVALVSLCGDAPGAIASVREPPTGHWPSSSDFDVIIDRVDASAAAIRLAPGHLHRSWTSEQIADVDIDAVIEELWQ